ncbi:GNAT family N-acetyltransferase [Candidatus Micrarchaeota archaeon]|nr:GNAT family N-acetyltransferase [Candidatus Micrarchaeota archaeon]
MAVKPGFKTTGRVQHAGWKRKLGWLPFAGGTKKWVRYPVLKRGQFAPGDFRYQSTGTGESRKVDVFLKKPGYKQVRLGSFGLVMLRGPEGPQAQLVRFYPIPFHHETERLRATSGAGIGRHVLAEAERQARQMGAGEIMLHEGPGAGNFFEKQGFKLVPNSGLLKKRLK